MTEVDRERWEARWADKAKGAGAPEPYLVRNLHRLPAGPVLDVAAGDGRNALLMARAGFAVTAVDVSPIAMERLAASAAAENLGIVTRAVDLDDPTALGGLGPFTGMAVVRYKPRAVQWSRLLDVLAPSGSLLLCSFGLGQHEEHGFNRAFCLERGELETMLGIRLDLVAYEPFAQDGDHLEGSLWRRRS